MTNARPAYAREDGQSIVIVVLFMVVLLGFCALVLDVGHAYLAQRQLQSSVDAAALAGADSLPDVSAATNLANQYGNGGSNTPGSPDSVNMTVTTKCLASVPGGCTVGSANAVTVKETGVVNTIFGRILGVSSLNVNATATACSPCGAKPLDIMLVFDRTGSMCTPDCSAFTDAKSAMDAFLEELDPSLDHVGLAVLPPASTNGSCGAPGFKVKNGTRTQTVYYLTPNDQYVLVPLSSDYLVSGQPNPSSSLVQTIGCVPSAGSTAYANAIEAAQAELVKDGRPNTQRVIILFSDGAANNGPTSYPDSSPYRLQPCHQGVASASTIKAAGTIVYSIGYGVGRDPSNICESSDGSAEPPTPTIQAEDALKGIASPGNYYATPDSNQFEAIYAAIAADLLAGTSRLVDDSTS